MNFLQRVIHRVRQAPEFLIKIKTLRGSYCRWFHRPVFTTIDHVGVHGCVDNIECVKCGYKWKEYESYEYREAKRAKEIREQEEQQEAILNSDAFFCYTCSALEDWDCVCEADLGFDEEEIYHDHGT